MLGSGVGAADDAAALCGDLRKQGSALDQQLLTVGRGLLGIHSVGSFW
jgi:hypothetical protein